MRRCRDPAHTQVRENLLGAPPSRRVRLRAITQDFGGASGWERGPDAVRPGRDAEDPLTARARAASSRSDPGKTPPHSCAPPSGRFGPRFDRREGPASPCRDHPLGMIRRDPEGRYVLTRKAWREKRDVEAARRRLRRGNKAACVTSRRTACSKRRRAGALCGATRPVTP